MKSFTFNEEPYYQESLIID